MKEFKSFYKEVTGNEGSKCLYNKRLDTYGCGCSHDSHIAMQSHYLTFESCGTQTNHLWQTYGRSNGRLQRFRKELLSGLAV